MASTTKTGSNGTPDPPPAERAPVPQEVELGFLHFEDMAWTVAANLSTTGIFLCSDDPPPVGTTVAFRFRVEEWSPVQGTGKVIGRRGKNEGPERPAWACSSPIWTPPAVA